MSGQQIGTRVLSIRANGAITKKRAVNRLGAQADDGTSSAGEAIIGFADTDIADDEVGRIIIGDTAIAEAGGVINGSEPRLKTDANGRLIVWTTDSIVAAILKPGQAATGSGQLIEVIPVIS